MDNQNGNKDNNKNNKQGFSFVILITMLTALLVFAMYQFQGVDSDQEITYNKFLKMIDEKKVEKVEIKSDRILITAKKESGDKVNKEYYTGRMNDDQLVEKLEKAKIDFNQDEYRITLKCLPENEEDSILGLTIITLEFEDEIVYPGVGWNRHTTRYGQLNCGYTYSKK